MVERVMVTRADDRQIVGTFLESRIRIRDRDPRLAAFSEVLGRPHHRGVHLRELQLQAIGDRRGQRLSVALAEQRLGVERIDMARTALHEQEDDMLRARRKLGRLRREWVREDLAGVGGGFGRRRGPQAVTFEKVQHRPGTEAEAGLRQDCRGGKGVGFRACEGDDGRGPRWLLLDSVDEYELVGIEQGQAQFGEGRLPVRSEMQSLGILPPFRGKSEGSGLQELQGTLGFRPGDRPAEG